MTNYWSGHGRTGRTGDYTLVLARLWRATYRVIAMFILAIKFHRSLVGVGKCMIICTGKCTFIHNNWPHHLYNYIHDMYMYTLYWYLMSVCVYLFLCLCFGGSPNNNSYHPQSQWLFEYIYLLSFIYLLLFIHLCIGYSPC